jgi:type VI secretion system secreted protein Hcp
MAAIDIFLKLDGIQGESTDHKHKEEIVLESFSWGETNTGAHATGGGAGAGKVSMQDFHFTSRVSKASPKLMLACATGQHIKNGVVTVRRSSAEQESQFEFLFYKFDTVIITSVQDAGDTSDRPSEHVSFAFAKIDVEYKVQSPDGVASTIDFAWDLAANRKG